MTVIWWLAKVALLFAFSIGVRALDGTVDKHDLVVSLLTAFVLVTVFELGQMAVRGRGDD